MPYKSDPDKNDLAKGLTIFNTTINCLEFWNGSKWISSCEGEMPPYIPVTPSAEVTITSCLPYMFTYQTLKLTADYAATPAPTSHQWVVDGKLIRGANSATFAYTPARNIALTEDELGNYKKTVKITCQMTVGEDVVQAADYEVLVVYAQHGQLSPIYVNAWNEEAMTKLPLPSISLDPDTEIIKTAFAHVNLGAEYELDPCLMLGDLYQWGRKKDGHEKRNSGIYTGPVDADDLDAVTDANGQIVSTHDAYGLFITNGSSNYDWRSYDTQKRDLWGDGDPNYPYSYNPTWTHPTNNPCPTGWKVPSYKQWGALYAGLGSFGDPTSVLNQANTWAWIGDMPEVHGYKLSDALYLPAAGTRDHRSGMLTPIGSVAFYWSATSRKDFDHTSYALFFLSSSLVNTNYYQGYRAQGFSIRCIAE